jgi:HEAT repeat protein
VRSSILALLLACLALCTPRIALPADLDAIFADMEQRGATFDAKPLHELGVAGLEAVFDRWLPQSRLTESRLPVNELLRELAANLGHEDYKVRSESTRRLILFGEQARPHIVEASRSGDPEVRLQATTILQAWKKERAPGLEEDERRRTDNFRNACYAYLAGIDDDERLRVFLRRTMLALEVGLQPHDSRTKLRPCLRRIAALKQDRWCSELLPLLKHDDPQIPVFVIHSLGAARQNDFFPTLLLEALASERPEIVEAALSWALNCSDQVRRPQLRQQLRKLLEQPNEPLKFAACWPLIHDFQDEAALEYVLTQASSEDIARARTALGWIAEAARGQRLATPQVLERLSPLLQSGDMLLRRDAAQALAAFQGEEVVRVLIPLLLDEEPSVAQVAADELASAKDPELKRKLLTETAEKHANPSLREAAGKVLERLK